MSLLQACLGLSFDVPGRLVRLEQPLLPEWLEQVTVRGITLCGDQVDVRVSRGPDLALEVLAVGIKTMLYFTNVEGTRGGGPDASDCAALTGACAAWLAIHIDVRSILG
jgi:hypothetical protein